MQLQLQPDITDKQWNDNLNKICRRFLTFEHMCFPNHLFRIKTISPSICDICNISADLHHIFFAYKSYAQHSEKLCSFLWNQNLMHPYNVIIVGCTRLGKKPMFFCKHNQDFLFGLSNYCLFFMRYAVTFIIYYFWYGKLRCRVRLKKTNKKCINHINKEEKKKRNKKSAFSNTDASRL